MQNNPLSSLYMAVKIILFVLTAWKILKRWKTRFQKYEYFAVKPLAYGVTFQLSYINLIATFLCSKSVGHAKLNIPWDQWCVNYIANCPKKHILQKGKSLIQILLDSTHAISNYQLNSNQWEKLSRQCNFPAKGESVFIFEGLRDVPDHVKRCLFTYFSKQNLLRL